MNSTKLEMLVLTLVAGALYVFMHFFNEWVFRYTEFTEHVNWVYLPAFLRLANVIVLGEFAGSVSTGLGVLVIELFFLDSPLTALLNIAASVSSPLLAFQTFRLLTGRAVNVHYLKDLFQAASIYAFLNSLTHHIAWSIADPKQFYKVDQVPIMFLGDLVGACLGAVAFTFVVQRTGLVNYIKERSQV
jgi:hypothetical protein